MIQINGVVLKMSFPIINFNRVSLILKINHDESFFIRAYMKFLQIKNFIFFSLNSIKIFNPLIEKLN